MPLQKNGHIKIAFAGQVDKSDAHYLANQINAIYLEEEKEIWPSDGRYERTNSNQIINYIRQQELVIARSQSGELMGSIRVYQHNGLWFFGILVTFPHHRKKGIGGQLVSFIESYLAARNIDAVYIELLIGDGFDMPNKSGLRQWYTAKGYTFVKNINFAEKDKSKVTLMKRPCYFEIMKKALV